MIVRRSMGEDTTAPTRNYGLAASLVFFGLILPFMLAHAADVGMARRARAARR